MIRACLYLALIALFSLSFYLSGGLPLLDTDWRSLSHTAISLIITLIIFEGALSLKTRHEKNKAKQRIATTLTPVFMDMHELWFRMAYESIDITIGRNRDFYSKEYKLEICKHLDLESQAPVLGNMTWRVYLFDMFRHFEKELKEINTACMIIGWDDLEKALVDYINSGFNQNIKTTLAGTQHIPGGIEGNQYLRVFGHWGNQCFDDYLIFIKEAHKLLIKIKPNKQLSGFDYFQAERIDRIEKAHQKKKEFGNSRLHPTPVENI